jgi:hypothetical protein
MDGLHPGATIQVSIDFVGRNDYDFSGVSRNAHQQQRSSTKDST